MPAIASYFYLLILSFLFFINFGFFFLSEEVLVFSSSLLFLFLVFLALRGSSRRYFFLRSYHIFAVFLSVLLMYNKALKSVHLVMESLRANVFVIWERNHLGQQTALNGLLLSLHLLETSLLRSFQAVALSLHRRVPVTLWLFEGPLSLRPKFKSKSMGLPCSLS